MEHIFHVVGLRRSIFGNSIKIALWAVHRLVLNNTVHTVNFFFLRCLAYLDVLIICNFVAKHWQEQHGLVCATITVQ